MSEEDKGKETASHITAGRYLDAKASLDEAYKALIAQLPSAGSEPVAWSYELAHAVGTFGYSDWQKHLSETKPDVPAEAIRKLRPLYASEPQAPLETARLIDALRRISEIEPVEGKASKNRGAMIHMRSIALAALDLEASPLSRPK